MKELTEKLKNETGIRADVCEKWLKICGNDYNYAKKMITQIYTSPNTSTVIPEPALESTPVPEPTRYLFSLIQCQRITHLTKNFY